MMIVYVYPQSLVYGTIGPSSTIRVSHPLHENHHAWASTTGDAIERHTNKKKKRKVPKERKENL